LLFRPDGEIFRTQGVKISRRIYQEPKKVILRGVYTERSESTKNDKWRNHNDKRRPWNDKISAIFQWKLFSWKHNL